MDNIKRDEHMFLKSRRYILNAYILFFFFSNIMVSFFNLIRKEAKYKQKLMHLVNASHMQMNQHFSSVIYKILH